MTAKAISHFQADHILTRFVFPPLHIGFAQDLNSLFDEFKKEPNADCISISPFMMAIGKMFMGNDSDAKLARKFKSIRILDLEACSTSVKERFSKKINAQRIKDYETLVQVNDEGEKVHILAKSKNDVIRELLIVCTGNGDCTLVQLKGKVSKEKIAKLLAKEEMM